MIPGFDSADSSYTLMLSTNEYSVISWSKNEIVSTSNGECRITMLTLNSKANEVYEITRNNDSEGCKSFLAELPKLEHPRVARLVEGFETTYAYWRERNDKSSNYMNSVFAETVKALMPSVE